MPVPIRLGAAAACQLSIRHDAAGQARHLRSGERKPALDVLGMIVERSAADGEHSDHAVGCVGSMSGPARMPRSPSSARSAGRAADSVRRSSTIAVKSGSSGADIGGDARCSSLGLECRLERVVPQQIDRKFGGAGHQDDEPRQPLGEIVPGRMVQPGDGFGDVDIGRMGVGGDVPLEHLGASAQVDAEVGDRRAVAVALGKLRLELRGVGDLPAANVADQQRDAGPAHRLGRDPADIAIHVLATSAPAAGRPNIAGRPRRRRRRGPQPGRAAG